MLRGLDVSRLKCSPKISKCLSSSIFLSGSGLPVFRVRHVGTSGLSLGSRDLRVLRVSCCSGVGSSLVLRPQDARMSVAWVNLPRFLQSRMLIMRLSSSRQVPKVSHKGLGFRGFGVQGFGYMSQQEVTIHQAHYGAHNLPRRDQRALERRPQNGTQVLPMWFRFRVGGLGFEVLMPLSFYSFPRP